MHLQVAQKRMSPASLLVWAAITLLFLYERTYLIQKAGLPHLFLCVTVRVGLLMVLCYVHNNVGIRLLVSRKFARYSLFMAVLISLYLLMQGLYDYYLFGYVIGDREQLGLWQNLPYNLIATVWYLLITYLIHRQARPVQTLIDTSVTPTADVSVDMFTLKTGTEWVRVPVDQIRYVQGLKDYSILFTTSGKHIVKGSIGQTADLLPLGRFVRTHKSYLVAKEHIKSVSSTGVKLADEVIPVGRTYLAEVLEQFKRGE